MVDGCLGAVFIHSWHKLSSTVTFWKQKILFPKGCLHFCVTSVGELRALGILEEEDLILQHLSTLIYPCKKLQKQQIPKIVFETSFCCACCDFLLSLELFLHVLSCKCKLLLDNVLRWYSKLFKEIRAYIKRRAPSYGLH